MTAPAVRLSEVTVTYPSGTRALDRVDLDIEPGERVALVGRSGAGKSTLLNVINGRALIDGARLHGTVDVLGLDPRQARGRAGRRHAARVGTIRQDHDLVGPMLVVHNVNAGRLARWSTWRAARSLVRPVERDDVASILRQVGLESDLLSARVDELSGGQRQRVAVARVLRQRPELVLADEPVASLDPALSEVVLDLLVAGWRPESTIDGPTTAVVSLHQPDYARRFATRVIGVRDGRIEFDVAVAQLTDELLSRVYGS